MSINEWQAALSEKGAVFEDGIVSHFGQDTSTSINPENSNIICDLSHLAILEIGGEDAVTFLQGQVSNDVKQLDGSNAHLSAYCTAKGRMLALFLAFAHNGHIHLQLPQTIATSIAKRLSMYVLRAKVQIKDISDNTVRLGISGPQAAALLSATISTNLPTAPFGLLSLENATILSLPTLTGHHRYQVFCSSEMAIKLWHQLQEHCQPVSKMYWDWLDIQTGLPEITVATQEQFVPQMLNLDLLNGISFKKGCYTGQEIVARTHYLGTVKRRTFLAHIQTDQAPQAGDKLFDAQQNEVGMIVRTAKAPTDGFDVLAELRVEAQQANQVVWNTLPLNFKPLPYALE